jgi:hypothetical protein
MPPRRFHAKPDNRIGPLETAFAGDIDGFDETAVAVDFSGRVLTVGKVDAVVGALPVVDATAAAAMEVVDCGTALVGLDNKTGTSKEEPLPPSLPGGSCAGAATGCCCCCCAISFSSRDRVLFVVVVVGAVFGLIAVGAATLETGVMGLPLALLPAFAMLLLLVLLLLVGMMVVMAFVVLQLLGMTIVVAVLVVVTTVPGLTGGDRGIALDCRKDKRSPPPPPPPLLALATLDTSDKTLRLFIPSPPELSVFSCSAINESEEADIAADAATEA